MTKLYSANRFMVYSAAKGLLADLGEMPTRNEISAEILRRFGKTIAPPAVWDYAQEFIHAGKLPRFGAQGKNPERIGSTPSAYKTNIAATRHRDPYSAPVDVLIRGR